LKVLIYTHDWFPAVGGLQTVTRDLANGLSDLRKNHGPEIDVTLVTQTPAGAMNDAELPFRVIRRPTKRQLLGLVRSADVVHVANPALVPLAMGWLLRKPTVLEHDGYQSACPNGLFLFDPDKTVCPGHYRAGRYGKCIECNAGAMGWPKSLRTLMLTFPRRWLSRRVTVNIAPTNHIGRRVALPKTRVIPHGVPDYSAGERFPSAGNNTETPYFAYVGRLVTEKGLPVLLHACSILCGKGAAFRLKIVGDGTERGPLERLAGELGLGPRVEFVGSMPVADIPAVVRDALAVIMPSICEDVAPLVAYEQLMQGNLVIGSDIGGLGELVEGVGLKFPPGDSEALAGCMLRVLEDPNLAAELRRRAYRRAHESFTLGHMVASHLGVYQELTAANGRSS
jgi:glycosyltransferase involved in cell wall biosynthesis